MTGRRMKNKEAPEIQPKRIKKFKYDLLGESRGEGEQKTTMKESKDDSIPPAVPSPPLQKTIGVVDRPKQTRITAFLSEGSPTRNTTPTASWASKIRSSGFSPLKQSIEIFTVIACL